eukprot:3940102-Rhodomonas_salina.1
MPGIPVGGSGVRSTGASTVCVGGNGRAVSVCAEDSVHGEVAESVVPDPAAERIGTPEYCSSSW